MITPAQLNEAFQRNARIVHMQAAGLTHEDSLIQPRPTGNCLNWVVGHILNSRDEVLRTLEADPVFGVEGERYARESDPVLGEGPGVLSLEHLLGTLDESQRALDKALSPLSDAEMGREMEIAGRRRRVGDVIFFRYFHETYHVGQAELLRQLAGKNDKVI